MPIKIKKTDETKLKMKREDFWKYIFISHEILNKESYKINDKTIFRDDFIDNYNKKLNEYKRKIGYINKKYPKITFHWCTQFPSSMKEVCPALFKKMYF